MTETFRKLCEAARPAYAIDPSLYSKYNVKRGLRNADNTGVLVGLTNIGDAHGYILNEGDKIPDEGVLRYRGVDVRDIVNRCREEDRHGYEEVVYLLLFGKLPTKEELNGFTKFLGKRHNLPDGFTEDMILKAPSPNIMNKLARAILATYSYDDDPDTLTLENMLRQSIELIARIPTMVTYGYYAKVHYYDKKSLIIHAPDESLSTAENFLHMIRPDNNFSKLEADTLDECLIIHAEHGGGNNSTFTTHVVSSSGTDTYSALAAAVGSLKGPLHGGANIKVREMIDDFKANIKDITDAKEVGAYIEKILQRQAFDGAGLVYGMGHAIYTKSDPRAVLLKEKARVLAKEKNREDEFCLYELVETLTPSIFNRLKNTDRVMCANVDLYSGFVYSMLGIPHELYTPIFAISRAAGWCAHRMEEVLVGGKIIRPAYKNVVGKSPYFNLGDRK
ncbi:MAG: citrate/2-methylcitrate synthase [Clostridia bacterium]|nr:citrate/2-methylcitrate synthase [Clostridia bacterium]